jgi:hypothetical protein
MPAHSDTNGMGAQIPTEKYGVGSPFQAGGGGGGGGGGSGAATQVLVGGSNTVPKPHSTALLTPGETTVTNATGHPTSRTAACHSTSLTELPSALLNPSSPVHHAFSLVFQTSTAMTADAISFPAWRSSSGVGPRPSQRASAVVSRARRSAGTTACSRRPRPAPCKPLRG